jgi:hypothetical protein
MCQHVERGTSRGLDDGCGAQNHEGRRSLMQLVVIRVEEVSGEELMLAIRSCWTKRRGGKSSASPKTR